MAKRKTANVAPADDLLPERLLVRSPFAGTGEREQREDRRLWFAQHGLTTWQQQYAALVRAKAAHGITEPDPRLILTDDKENLTDDHRADHRAQRRDAEPTAAAEPGDDD